MTDLSTTRETAILNDIAAGGVYVSLHTADEGNEPDGTNEVVAADYAREFLAEADISVSGGGPSTLTNDVVVDFGTTENDWGTVTHGALWTTAAGEVGEEPYTATVPLTNSGAAPSGIQVRIDAGALTFEMD